MLFVHLDCLMCGKNVVIPDKILILDLICSLCLKIIIRCYCGSEPGKDNINTSNNLVRFNSVFISISFFKLTELAYFIFYRLITGEKGLIYFQSGLKKMKI